MSPDGAVPEKGTERLTDRDIGLECEDSGTTGTRIWHIDRGVGAAATPVDTWIFSGSHYTGETLELESSDDDTSWDARGSVTPASDDPQRVELTPFNAPRYLRVTVTDPALPIIFTEMVLTEGVVLSWKPSVTNLREPQMPNVVQLSTTSGRTWGVKRGSRRWSAIYVMQGSPDSDRTLVLAMLDAIDDGVTPFWLLTVTSELRWVRVNGAIGFQAANMMASDWDIPLQLVEELP